MSNIEALRLALDALENTASWNASQQYTREQKAIKAIKAALEAKDEPVAWMHKMDNTEGIKANGTGIVSITKKRKHPFGKAGVDFSKSYPITSTPLYTTPPQRKPLTEQEIGAILEDINAFGTRLYTFARAIEAAHGIKGEA